VRDVESDNLKDFLGGIGEINIPKLETITSNTYAMFDPNRKKYHSPEEIIEEDKDDYKRPDFSEWKCKICNDLIEEGYSWYYLRHEGDESKSVAVCSKECLDKFIKSHSCSDYEIYEYSRCNAYFKCKEIGNLRNMCETVENKTYQSILPLSLINHCQPAQAGTILSTHKLTEVLVDFSKQTEEQFLLNTAMLEKSAEESSKQFKITTWMTVLVIILTIANLVPTILNWGGNDYSDQLTGIEASIDGINSTEELSDINDKLLEITDLLNAADGSNADARIDNIIELLESIEAQLNDDAQ
jgi:hypothetical protein